jgi:hypothetical protein
MQNIITAMTANSLRHKKRMVKSSPVAYGYHQQLVVVDLPQERTHTRDNWQCRLV